ERDQQIQINAMKIHKTNSYIYRLFVGLIVPQRPHWELLNQPRPHIMNTSTDLSQQMRAERTAVETLYRAFSEQNPDLVDTVQAPGKIAVRAEISGTHLGELFGIAPTGKKVSFRLHEFHTLAHGLVTTTWHMEDWFGLFLQLGQFPPQG